eukprot:TRINITY_DN5203_c3_g1_i3.p1 TRINITY_DN5203_c3_g1~~TRINITY_DN5203_c3_g1_i3.p1  ORF type:complete len:594 (-),score=83.32 TRINITY_DN5203_c3_g1_i3:288-2069(-)
MISSILSSSWACAGELECSRPAVRTCRNLGPCQVVGPQPPTPSVVSRAFANPFTMSRRWYSSRVLHSTSNRMPCHLQSARHFASSSVEDGSSIHKDGQSVSLPGSTDNLTAALVAGCAAGASVYVKRNATRRSYSTHVGAGRVPVEPVAAAAAEEEEMSKACQLPPLPTNPKNKVFDFDKGPFSNPAELEGEAFYIPSLIGQPEDRSVFDRLMEELDFRTCWLNTGMKFSREICLGDEELLAKSPTYRAIVERVSNFFGVRVVRTLVNLYRDGDDWCNLHSDQYQQGGYPIDLTVGATFGDPRRLIWVKKKNENHQLELPQQNGDIFAFSDRINNRWRHMIPREGPQCGPRISVIVWCSRGGYTPEVEEPSRLGKFPHMLYYNPKGSGRDFVAHQSRRFGKGQGKGAAGGWKGAKGRFQERLEDLPMLADRELDDAMSSLSKAITLQGAQQVYAILRGYKLIENRSWPLPVGWYAIHAGFKMINPERAARTLHAWPDAPPEETLPHSAIAGLFYVQEHRKPWQCQEGYVFARGPVCSIISRAIELPRPIHTRGGSGLWDIQGGIRQEIHRQLAEAGSRVRVRHFDVRPATGDR